MSAILRRLLEERRLIASKLGKEAVKKELDGAAYDLQSASSSFATGDFKWATIKAYYSMFHAGRALLYSAGYRERSHSVVITVLRELYVKPGRLSEDALNDLENAMELREEADYSLTFSEEGSERVVSDAKGFLEIARTLLR